MRVHVIRTGTVTQNTTFWRGESWSTIFRKAKAYEIPVQCYVVEHPDGHVAIDTGLSSNVPAPKGLLRRFVPIPHAQPGDEVGPQMRAVGLDPNEVRFVILTHLDWDHAGGVGHFPNAKILVHRPELTFASTSSGKMRYQTKRWPSGFSPIPFDLDPDPYVSFPESKKVTDAGDVVVVPTRGHSAGHVSVVVRTGDAALFFAGDHLTRQDWFREDYAKGRLVQLGQFFPNDARETSRRIHRFAEAVPTILLPSHDGDAAERLATRELLLV